MTTSCINTLSTHPCPPTTSTTDLRTSYRQNDSTNMYRTDPKMILLLTSTTSIAVLILACRPYIPIWIFLAVACAPTATIIQTLRHAYLVSKSTSNPQSVQLDYMKDPEDPLSATTHPSESQYTALPSSSESVYPTPTSASISTMQIRRSAHFFFGLAILSTFTAVCQLVGSLPAFHWVSNPDLDHDFVGAWHGVTLLQFLNGMLLGVAGVYNWNIAVEGPEEWDRV